LGKAIHVLHKFAYVMIHAFYPKCENGCLFAKMKLQSILPDVCIKVKKYLSSQRNSKIG